MVNSMDTYNSLNINTGTVIKDPEILKFVPDPLKTKQICNYAVEKLCLLLRYVPDQCKTKKCVIDLF